jgi:SRSO17 transposase
LYLPKAWAEDADRRAKAGVPEDIAFKTKPEIALDQIRWACASGLPGDMALLDAGYGHDGKLRAGITELGKCYVAGIQPQTLVWKPGTRPGQAPRKGRRGDLGQGPRPWTAGESMAHDQMARRHQ